MLVICEACAIPVGRWRLLECPHLWGIVRRRFPDVFESRTSWSIPCNRRTPEPRFSIRVTRTRSARRSGSISTPRSVSTSSCTIRWRQNRLFTYDLILAANLIDRLYDPKKFLETIHERLNLGGVLVISSPYTWLEEFTKKQNWLGGIRRAGEPYMTLDALRDLLGAHFVMLGTPQDVEFIIRERDVNSSTRSRS